MVERKFVQGEGKARGVWASGESLFGGSGGQLEFVSIKTIWKRLDEYYPDLPIVPWVVIRFTDHDVRATKEAPVNKLYYELEFPLCQE